MRCEMCGEEVESPNRVRIEGTELRLCLKCSRFGTVLGPMPPSPGTAAAAPGTIENRLRGRSKRLEERDLFQELPELELLPDWSKRIRQAREKLGWSPEEFGRKLNEKKSLVLKLESGNFRPPDETVRKVEQLLKIRLRANPGELG
ncbi:MAG: multiprotein bridging factor aMBF1 [Thermoplasmata archaeon]